MIKFISKIGRSKTGLTRIWLEGARLTKAGFTWQTKYKTAFCGDFIMLTLDPKGDRKVSGRWRNDRAIPILDLRSSRITEFARHFEQVEAEITEGKILIKLVKVES